jgi:Alanine racemase, N-terminal domain
LTIKDIETPALLLDLDRMEANLERMAAFFRKVPAKLRPHFKNHKCPDLAARQLDAGAIGITCATLREAECLVHHGVRSVLLGNEIVDPAKIRRFVELARQADIIVCVDNDKVVDAREARNRNVQVSVLVDVDVGLHRCGVSPGQAAVERGGSGADSRAGVGGDSQGAELQCAAGRSVCASILLGAVFLDGELAVMPVKVTEKGQKVATHSGTGRLRPKPGVSQTAQLDLGFYRALGICRAERLRATTARLAYGRPEQDAAAEAAGESQRRSHGNGSLSAPGQTLYRSLQ